ncbi:MAG: DUF433 domain-containing protein [Acidobacteria bacterium]|nr:DUF433 domain-containing protein [Acidobacteriota bacterium]
MTQKAYVNQLTWEDNRETKIAYRVADTRVSLDSVVINWLNGESPEGIVDNFPSLTLEQVYGALAFYLANREEIDEYLRQGDLEFEKMRQRSWEDLRQNRPLLYQKLMAAKRKNQEAA